MNHADIDKELERLAAEYGEKLQPIIAQSVVHGAIFGSVHFPVANKVREDLKRQIDKFPEFASSSYGNPSSEYSTMIEAEWSHVMLSLQSIVLPGGKRWIENFDEQSAYQGFVAGAEFVKRKIYERLSEVLKDKKEERK